MALLAGWAVSQQKPVAWLYEQPGGRDRDVYFDGAISASGDTVTPLYRRSPTHKEEQAVVRAAVKWRRCRVGDWSGDDALWAAVDRLLAKRKSKP